MNIGQSFHQAVEYYQAGQQLRARDLCQKVLMHEADHIDAMRLMIAIEQQAADYAKVIFWCEKLLALVPDNVEVLCSYGLSLSALQQHKKAIAVYDAILLIDTQHAQIWFNRGNALYATGEIDKAIADFDRALAINPQYVKALSNRGLALQDQANYDLALDSYNRAIAIDAGNAVLFFNRGSVLHKMQRLNEALIDYDMALKIMPTYIEAHSNKGAVLQALQRDEEALICYDTILAIDPHHASVMCSRGDVLKSQRQYQQALDCYNKAILFDANLVQAQFNVATTHLLMGDFNKGWPQYEWRWKLTNGKIIHPHYDKPVWLGEESIQNKALLVHIEQGFGDIIQFSRYVKVLKKLGATVIVGVVPTEVYALLTQVLGIDYLVTYDEAFPHFDYYCPLLSLPLACKTNIENIPADIPYLNAPSAYCLKWEKLITHKNKLKVGIVWSGNPAYTQDARRSMPLKALTPLFASEIDFYCLQKKIDTADQTLLGEHTNVHVFNKDIADFADVAAIIALMDVVISVDTAAVHLAGAMGKETYAMLPYVAEWRWLIDREDTPWYPTMRLMRQQKSGDWASVITQVKEKLISMMLHR